MAKSTLPGDVRPAKTTRATSTAVPTSRRALLRTLAVAPLALTAVPTAATVQAVHDPRWPALVADYHATREGWVAICAYDDDLAPEVEAGLASLPPKPIEPSSGLPDDISHMTIAQIKATGNTPEHKAAWADYERDLAEWKRREEAIRQSITGPAKALYEKKYAAYTVALNALATYRVPGLIQLAEKIEIIAADYDSSDIPEEYIADILADVRHLAQRGAQA